MESMVEKQAPPNIKVIDREKTCPLLLRVFCGAGGRHNSISEFSHGNVPSNEVIFFLGTFNGKWLSCTFWPAPNLHLDGCQLTRVDYISTRRKSWHTKEGNILWLCNRLSGSTTTGISNAWNWDNVFGAKGWRWYKNFGSGEILYWRLLGYQYYATESHATHRTTGQTTILRTWNGNLCDERVFFFVISIKYLSKNINNAFI